MNKRIKISPRLGIEPGTFRMRRSVSQTLDRAVADPARAGVQHANVNTEQRRQEDACV